MDGRQNENLNDKEIQSFFHEIDDLVNEENADNLLKDENELTERCLELIEKKKNSDNLPIKSKISLFIEEIEFINNIFDTYEKEKKISANEIFLKEDGNNESDDILKDVIYLELGLKESENTNETKKLLLNISENLDKIENKEFVLSTKKSLDIRINDFRQNEISEEYFSRKINEIYLDIKNQLNSETIEKEKKLNENIIENSKNTLIDASSKNNLIDVNSKNNLIDTKLESNSVPLISVNEGNKNTDKITTKKNKKEHKIESHNYFHKKKLKLVERWNKVAEETKLLNNYDSNY